MATWGGAIALSAEENRALRDYIAALEAEVADLTSDEFKEMLVDSAMEVHEKLMAEKMEEVRAHARQGFSNYTNDIKARLEKLGFPSGAVIFILFGDEAGRGDN